MVLSHPVRLRHLHDVVDDAARAEDPDYGRYDGPDDSVHDHWVAEDDEENQSTECARDYKICLECLGEGQLQMHICPQRCVDEIDLIYRCHFVTWANVPLRFEELFMYVYGLVRIHMRVLDRDTQPRDG